MTNIIILFIVNIIHINKIFNHYYYFILFYLIYTISTVYHLLYLPPDMIVKPGHPYVEPDGAVTVPCMQIWAISSSNLRDLVTSLSILFGNRNIPHSFTNTILFYFTFILFWFYFIYFMLISHRIGDMWMYVYHEYLYVSCTGNDPPLYTRQSTAALQQQQQQQKMNNNHYPLQTSSNQNNSNSNSNSNKNYSINNQQVYQGIPVNGANIKPINGPAAFNPPFSNAYPTSNNQVSTHTQNHY